jgi:hypothetical protein
MAGAFGWSFGHMLLLLGAFANLCVHTKMTREKSLIMIIVKVALKSSENRFYNLYLYMSIRGKLGTMTLT